MKIEKLRSKIVEEDLDAFIAKQNAPYFSEAKNASVLIITEEESILICGRLAFDRAKEESIVDDVRAYSKSEIPLRKGETVIVGKLGEVIGQILENNEAEKIGYDSLNDEILESLKEKHEADYQKKPEIVWNLRKVKTEKELSYIEKAVEIAEEGLKKADEIIETGKTELEVAAEIEYEMRKIGSEGTAFDTILASGENSLYPHIEPTERELKDGDLIVVDLGARWNGYKSDMTRTFSLSPTEKQKEILKIAKEAKKAATEKIEAGIKASKVDEAARKVFRKNNYEKYFLHGTGHGVGLNIHEPPTVSPTSDDILEEGNLITIEPGIYVDGVGGGRFEDMFLVREDGFEKLTSI